MNAGEIVQVGEPREIYEYPSTRFVADFIGSVNMFEGRVTEDEPDYIRLATPEAAARDLRRPRRELHAEPDAVVRAAAGEAPHHPRAARAEATMSSRRMVEEVAYMGNLSIYRLRLDTGKMVRATRANLDPLRRATRSPGTRRSGSSWDDTAGVVLAQ